MFSKGGGSKISKNQPTRFKDGPKKNYFTTYPAAQFPEAVPPFEEHSLEV